MGKVILVPAMSRFEIPVPANGGQFTGMSHVYPVQMNMTSGYNDVVAGVQSHVLAASVTIQDPKTEYHYHDPMLSYAAFYSFSGSSGGTNITSRALGGASPLIHRVDATMVPRMFWDHTEIEDIVHERFHGHLLVQINNQSSDYREPSTWNFCAADGRDNAALSDMLTRRKSNKLESHKGLRTEVAAWLRANATDYDLFDAAHFAEPNDEVYIRNATEAIHFKMKWHKQEPDPEEIEVPF
jgi:hypothetical protein